MTQWATLKSVPLVNASDIVIAMIMHIAMTSAMANATTMAIHMAIAMIIAMFVTRAMALPLTMNMAMSMTITMTMTASHTITAHSPELTVDAEVAYAGALVCATVSNTSASGALPWYELRT